ncbi:MAG: M20/M25/M40 family metallo-hydrolase [Clostridia bacterium]
MIFELTKEICGVFGPSGREKDIANAIKSKIEGYIDEVYTDNLGNLIAHKKGTGAKVMVSAHMDSIGMVVSYIEDDGFLRFGSVGGLSKADLINIPVRFKNGTRGVVSHTEGKKFNDLTIADFFIDIGAKDKAEAMEYVKVGDFAVYATDCVKQGNVIIGPYMDDRIACVAQIMAIQNPEPSDKDIYYVFSAQEEVGLRGATVASYAIDPDFGIAIDVTDTGDTPDKTDKMAVKLGEGACVKIMDRSVICSEKVRDTMFDAAKELGINAQSEVLRFGGTDTGAMQRARGGALVGAISIGTRYIHSPQEMVNISDVIDSSKLLAMTIKML